MDDLNRAIKLSNPEGKAQAFVNFCGLLAWFRRRFLIIRLSWCSLFRFSSHLTREKQTFKILFVGMRTDL